jgi:membrane protein implicated in regulation of membrane protease activity
MFGFESYILWFIAAMILIGYELIAGFSLLFLFLLGLAALCVGFATHLGYVDPDSFTSQLIIFLTLFVVFFVLFWKPIKRIINQNANANYSNIVGQKAEVINGPITKKSGKVRWSGTEVNAILTKNDSLENLEAGETVEIIEIKDNTF